MIIDDQAIIDAPIEEVWDFILDVPRVGGCLPGAEEIVDLGNDQYGGVLAVKVGAISVRLNGKVAIVERNDDQHLARLQVEASDRRIRGSVKAEATMVLRAVNAEQTEMNVHADAAVLGKLGQFGQAVLRKKTNQVLGEFVGNVSQTLRPALAAAMVGDPQHTDPDASRSATTAGQSTTADAVRLPTKRSSGGAGLAPWALATGVALGVVAAIRDEMGWSMFALSLVIWGAIGRGRTSGRR